MNEQETLMELVETGKKLKVSVKDFDEQKFSQIEHLRELGFTSLADNLEKDFKHIKLKRIADAGYIAIPEENITAYLKRKAERYNREHEKKKKSDPTTSEDAFSVRDIERTYWMLLENDPMPQPYEMPNVSYRVRGSMISKPVLRALTDEFITIFNNTSHIPLRILDYRIDSYDYTTQTHIAFEVVGQRTHPRFRYVLEDICYITERRWDYLKSEIEHSFLSNNPDYAREAESGRAFQYQQQMQEYRAEFMRRQAEAMRNTISEFAGLHYTSTGDYDTKISSAPESTFTEKTCDFYSSEPNTIGKFVYREVKVENYKGIPPKDVLTRLDEEKKLGLFEYYTIASVEGVKDPLLFGRLKDNKTRFFIAQWGEDITLDDLI